MSSWRSLEIQGTQIFISPWPCFNLYLCQCIVKYFCCFSFYFYDLICSQMFTMHEMHFICAPIKWTHHIQTKLNKLINYRSNEYINIIFHTMQFIGNKHRYARTNATKKSVNTKGKITLLQITSVWCSHSLALNELNVYRKFSNDERMHELSLTFPWSTNRSLHTMRLQFYNENITYIHSCWKTSRFCSIL